MSTPVGHILGAMTAVAAVKPLLFQQTKLPSHSWLFVVACALLADTDHVAIIPFPQLEEHIHGPTHSILFCLLLALVIVGLVKAFRSSSSGWRLALICFICAFMHPLQDYLMGVGPPVQVFWPISSVGWLSPIALLPTSYYSNSASGYLALLLYPPIVQAVAFETAAFTPLIMLTGEQSLRRRGLLCMISLSVILAVFVTYRPFKAYWDARGATLQRKMDQRVQETRESNKTSEPSAAPASQAQR